MREEVETGENSRRKLLLNHNLLILGEEATLDMSRANLDKVPEDAALSIIRDVQGFAEKGGSREEREIARK